MASALFLIPLQAQELSNLPAAPEIKTTELANGITCYIATCKESKGYADFALVQHPIADRQTTVAQARKALVHLPHFGSRRPCDFLSGLGVGYTERGYVNYQKNATIFDFRHVPVSNQAVADSMLLMLFDIADLNPQPQALIVSGDVDEAKFMDRIRMFSMTVSKREGSVAKDGYQWTVKPQPSCYFTGNPSSGVATIRVSYAGARTPESQMNTLQPAVSRQYAAYMGTVIENRVRADFRAQDIPLAEVRFRYYDSASGPGDEQYTISVITSAGRYDDAVRRVAVILADLDCRGADEAELKDAKDRFENETARDASSTRLGNSDYVRKCTAAYLYNATLASESTINSYFKNGRIPLDKELTLFNNFAAAILDADANLTIGFDTPRASLRTDLAETFRESWMQAAANPGISPAKPAYPDSLSLWTPDGKSKLKIKSEAADPISGGSIWTFSNGLKVVYRKTATKGKFHYSMMLRGGAGLVPSVGTGESAFIGDLLATSEIAGMHPEEFSAMLTANGISMTTGATLSDLSIEGTAPVSKLQMVLRSLLSVALQRKPDPEAIRYYKECEALRIELLRLSNDGITQYMDSLLCPGYRFPEFERMEAFSDDLPQRAEEFFSAQFSRCQDGVLVIIGDLEPEALKKDLCNYLGGFNTSRIFDARPKVERRMYSGAGTYTLDARESGLGDGREGAHFAMSVRVPYNMVNGMSLKVAIIALQQELRRSLSEAGASVDIQSDMQFYPEERAFIHIHCSPCDESGLPEGIPQAEPYDILNAVRGALVRLAENPLSTSQLTAYKEELRLRTESELDSDMGRIDAVRMRYIEGKDIVSGVKAGIDGVTAESVAAIIKELAGSGRIETVLI